MAFLKIFVNNIENKNQTVESYFAAIGNYIMLNIYKQKLNKKTLGLLLMLCLYNTIDTMTRGFIFPVKNVCELTLITQS